MNIKFASRSSFLIPCKAAIRKCGQKMKDGGSISINLHSGGFKGQICVTIKRSDFKSFGTNWNRSDPTWFPARIKAAATALHDSGYVGRFEITHQDGTLQIRQA
jgi:hypothetical protein